jgi:MFS family permease
MAPLAAITLHGPLIGESSYLWTQALAPYTPSRDMGTLWLCLLLHLIISCEEYSATYGRIRNSQLLAVFVAAFCLGGGKGSMAPIVIGALLVSGFVYLRKSESLKLFSFISMAIIGGFLASQILIVKSTGRLKFDPLSFADSLPGVGTIWPIIWGLCIFMPALGLLLGLRQVFRLPSIALALVFVFPLVGVAGILFLGHPGMGQLYFLSSVIPFFGVSVALLLGELWKNRQRSIILLIAISYFAVQVSWKSSTTFDDKHRALLIISVAISFALSGAILCQKSQFGEKKLALSATFLLTTTTLLGLSVSNGSAFDTGASSISTNSIHSDQLHAMTWLRENSDPYQMFITNKHCIAGSELTSDCYSRWFMATAISERRSPVEGYSYTYRNLDGPYWDPDLLKVLDQFIVAPTESVHKNLINSDVFWIYIDTNLPYSKDLSKFATLKFDSEQAQIYELFS